MWQNLVVSDEQIPHHCTMLQKIDRFRWVNITSGDFSIDSPPVCHALSIWKMYFTKRYWLIGNVFLHLVTNTILNTVLSTSIYQRCRKVFYIYKILFCIVDIWLMLFLLEMDSNLRFTPQLMPSRGWPVKDIVKASSNVRHWVKISSQDLLISVWFFSHNNMWLYAMAKERNVELYSSLAMLWVNLQQTQQWW